MVSKTTNHQPETVKEVDANEQLESRIIGSEVHKFAELSPTSPEVDQTKLPVVAWLVAFLLLLLGIVLTIRALTSSNLRVDSLSKPVVESSTPTSSPRVSLSPTALPAKNKLDLKVRVLNGSGQPGLASVVKSYLESVGYQNIDTGNADAFTYDQTVVSIRPNLDLRAKIVEDLKLKYSLSTSIGDLPVTGIYDFEVVVGKE